MTTYNPTCPLYTVEARDPFTFGDCVVADTLDGIALDDVETADAVIFTDRAEAERIARRYNGVVVTVRR